jgi:antitoxin component of MazEF toxin-antitoxin module
MQKVIQVGNSLAVTIDKKQAQLMKIEAGQPLAVVYKPEKGLMSLAKSKSAISTENVSAEESEAVVAGKITLELEQWTTRFLLENKEAMDRLANL